ncbi:MAG TPA: hypothetical protein VF759_06100 [Allosphingosinicella sp.]|jgi:hypothetical protein
MRHFALLALALVPAAAAAQPPAAAAAEAPIVAEAREFMKRYGDDLWQGNRTAIAERYDRTGAWHVGPGRAELETWDKIALRYRRRWAPPASFEWRNLAYEPLGPDSVLVVGGFLWWPQKKAEQAPLEYSYTGLLVRRDGQLRIRLENEAAAIPPSRR